MPHPPRPARRTGVLSGAAAAVLLLSACAPTTGQHSPGPATTSAERTIPSAHVHGLAVSGETGRLLLATHDGLFDVTSAPTRIGDANDLMGFTAGPADGVFYASGHPGPGSGLPNPLGLLKSSDAGKTWEQLSRQGESDFHAMTLTASGILAFDGTLRTSSDGRSWTSIDAAFTPAVLAGHPGSNTVLATTPDGIQRSIDSGKNFSRVKDGPVIQFAAFASPAEAVGVEPDGTVHVSSDAGTAWTKRGRIDARVQAIAAVKGDDGRHRIWAATAEGIVVSTDRGTTFRPVNAG